MGDKELLPPSPTKGLKTIRVVVVVVVAFVVAVAVVAAAVSFFKAFFIDCWFSKQLLDFQTCKAFNLA